MGKPVVGLWKYSVQSRIFKEVLQVPLYMRIEYETGGGDQIPENENSVRNDSLDSDEIAD